VQLPKNSKADIGFLVVKNSSFSPEKVKAITESLNAMDKYAPHPMHNWAEGESTKYNILKTLGALIGGGLTGGAAAYGGLRGAAALGKGRSANLNRILKILGVGGGGISGAAGGGYLGNKLGESAFWLSSDKNKDTFKRLSEMWEEAPEDLRGFKQD
jgi:hypothetical protein